MPLSKQAKALYEAALRRKGLPLDKATVQHARDFIGPRRTFSRPRITGEDVHGGLITEEHDVMSKKVPWNRYVYGRGRYQDLYDELAAAASDYRYDYPGYSTYSDLTHDWFVGSPNKKYIKSLPDIETMGYGYDDPSAYLYHPGQRKDLMSLTALGEEELEAQFEPDLIEGYKKYLKRMYEGKIRPRPDRYKIQFFDRPKGEWVSKYHNDIDEALKDVNYIRGLGHENVKLFDYPTSEYPVEE